MTVTPDYLLIGHVTHDETPLGPKLGGTTSYSGGAAHAMGAKVAIVTSARQDEVVLREIPSGIEIALSEAPASTIFVNTYENGIRRQILKSRAEILTRADVPDSWRDASIVHFGPLDDEIDLELVKAFPNSLLAATPQGWMRTWDSEGLVSPQPWKTADQLLPLLGVTVFSEEDIHRDTALEAHYASLASLLIVTRAANGCTVYQRGEPPMHLPAPSVPVVDATGAGDVFTGIFLVMLQRTKNVRQAAEIATELASCSVTRVGLAGIPTAEEIEHALKR